MSELRIVTLGTSSGKPTLSRNVASVALMLDGILSLFDCGEGTQLQFIRAGLKPSRVAVVCISHFHGDHINGLPGFLSTLSLNKHDRPVTVCGPKGLRTYFATLRRLAIFIPRYPLNVVEIEEEGVVYKGDAFQISAARVDHRIETWGFRFQEKDRPGRFDLAKAKSLGVPPGPMFGRLQRGKSVTTPAGDTVEPSQVLGPVRPGRVVAYVTDTRPCSKAIELARGAHILLHEGTYGPELTKEAHQRGHCTVEDAARAAKQAEVEQLVITHVSPKHFDLGPLVGAARKIFRKTRIAQDLDEFTIPVPE